MEFLETVVWLLGLAVYLVLVFLFGWMPIGQCYSERIARVLSA
jgi:hypothetical protein